MKKVSIEKVKNGYIVRVTKQDVGTLKEEYETPVFVFVNEQGLFRFLEDGFDLKKIPAQ